MTDQPQYKLCKRGHVRSPDNLNKGGACKQCLKFLRSSDEYRAKDAAWHRAYHRTPEGKAYLLQRKKTPADKARRKRYAAKYGQTPKNKEYRKEYNQRPETKARITAWRQSPAFKAREAARGSMNNEILTKSIVARLIGIPAADATPELIEIKRLTIQLKRSLKNVQHKKC